MSRHAGIFTWLAEPNGDVGRRVIAAGETIGTLDRLGEKVPVKSPFKGCLKGHMVVSGERVQSDQPLAWLSLV